MEPIYPSEDAELIQAAIVRCSRKPDPSKPMSKGEQVRLSKESIDIICRLHADKATEADAFFTAINFHLFSPIRKKELRNAFAGSAYALNPDGTFSSLETRVRFEQYILTAKP